MARDRLLKRNLQGLRIVLINDLVRLVIADIGTIVTDPAGDGLRLQTQQGLMQLGAIVGVVQPIAA